MTPPTLLVLPICIVIGVALIPTILAYPVETRHISWIIAILSISFLLGVAFTIIFNLLRKKISKK